MPTGVVTMVRQDKVEENIYDKAFDDILNTKFNAPGIPVLMAFEDLPEDEGEKEEEKKR